jgi:hypothetical protein
MDIRRSFNTHLLLEISNPADTDRIVANFRNSILKKYERSTFRISAALDESHVLSHIDLLRFAIERTKILLKKP